MTAPCVHAGGVVTSSQTTNSMVGVLRDEDQIWATGTSAPCLSLFKPVSVHEPVDVGGPATDQFSDSVLWWRHERVHRALLADFDHNLEKIWLSRDALESQWLHSRPTSVEAFSAAEELESSWLEGVGSSLVDRRPSYVQRRWAQLNQRAGLNSNDSHTLH